MGYLIPILVSRQMASGVSFRGHGTGRQWRKTPETGFRVCRETREASMFTASVINHQTTAGTGTVTPLYLRRIPPFALYFDFA